VTLKNSRFIEQPVKGHKHEGRKKIPVLRSSLSGGKEENEESTSTLEKGWGGGHNCSLFALRGSEAKNTARGKRKKGNVTRLHNM